MCSIITLRTDTRELVSDFRSTEISLALREGPLNIRAHGFMKREMSPVIFCDSSKRISMAMKYFSLCPSWAKEWPFKFSTYNARLNRPKRGVNPAPEEPLFIDQSKSPELEWISEVPSFKDSFRRGQTCLVPISEAIESCYFGVHAGNIVRFSRASNKVFYALGLWNDWINTHTGEVVPTYTLLTDDPDEFIFLNGHDRGLIVLQESDWHTWLTHRMHALERIDFIRSRRVGMNWAVEVERSLKPGWQKRSPSQIEHAQIRVFRG